ncbi:hypothetical protein ACN1C3_31800, partial [Pseudomonas sp. H11T01]|uniref:hypothetical protein n=1 Tax=Pseudomonas sp. H11T01 TaxID=3402749 RepID=UPI003AC02CA1
MYKKAPAFERSAGLFIAHDLPVGAGLARDGGLIADQSLAGVHIHSCGNGHLWFRPYGQPFQGLRLNSPKTPVRVTKTMWAEVLARFEKKAPASVMVKLA